MGFSTGTDKGMKPMGKGTDIFKKEKYSSYYYSTIAQSQSDQISSTVASGRYAPALRSSKLTNPTLLQYPRHIKARVDCTDK